MIRIMNLLPSSRPIWIPIIFLFAINSSILHGFTFDKEFTSSNHFIDKTLLLREFFASKSREFVTAPRGFGKTTNLKMIDKFSHVEYDQRGKLLPESRTATLELFKSLQIGAHENVLQHLGQHPVIFFDMDLQIDGEINDDKIRAAYSAQLNKTLSRYRELFDVISHEHLLTAEFTRMEKLASEVLQDFEIKMVIFNLATILNKHFNKSVVLLIDNYDHIVHNYFVDSKGYLDHVYRIFEEMLFTCYQHEPLLIEHTMVASVTGTAYRCFGLDKFFNQSCFYEIHPYTAYFGLAKPEVDELQKKYAVDGSNKTSIIEKYCGGYQIKGKDPVYNTSCVIDYLQATDKAAWIGLQKPSQPSKFLWKLFKTPEYLEQVSKLIKQCTIRHGRNDYISLTNFTKLVLHDFKEAGFSAGVNSTTFSYMIQTGLLSPILTRSVFVVPNLQARNQFMTDLFYYFEKVINIDLKLIGIQLDGFFNPQRDYAAPRTNLMESLTATFGKLTPIYNTHSKNKSIRIKCSSDFIYQSIVHLGALTNEQLQVIEDYPQPVSYDKSTANTNARCVTCIKKDGVALVIKISDQHDLKHLTAQRLRYSGLEKEHGVDLVIYVGIKVEPDSRVLIDVLTSKFVDAISGNTTHHHITSMPKVTRVKIKRNTTKGKKLFQRTTEDEYGGFVY